MEETTKITGTIQYGSFGRVKAMTHNNGLSLSQCGQVDRMKREGYRIVSADVFTLLQTLFA